MSLAEIVGPLDDPEEAARRRSLLLHEIGRRARAAEAASSARIVREEKFCPRCSTVKPASDFGIHAGRPDGLQGHCRECR